MENLKCKCCNRVGLKSLYIGKDRLHGLAGDFTLFICPNCGVVSVYPQLSNEEIEKYYPEEYISYPIPIEKETSKLKRLDRQYGVFKRRRKVERYTKKKAGRILDIGCATGVFLNEMKAHGWECYGIEPSVYASDIAKNQLGLNVLNGYLDDVQFDDHYFDVITLWDVFEHLANPNKTLRIIKRILKPDGTLVITMPNIDSWERKIFKQYWAGWDVPRHYHIFSENAIQNLLRNHGMHIDNLISFTGALGAIRISMDFWINSRRFTEKTRHLFQTIYNSLVFRFLLYPYVISSNLARKSTSMTIFVSNSSAVKK